MIDNKEKRLIFILFQCESDMKFLSKIRIFCCSHHKIIVVKVNHSSFENLIQTKINTYLIGQYNVGQK